MIISRIRGIAALMACAVAPAFGQYSTPTRDVENPDRTAFALNGYVNLEAPFINGFVTFASFPGKRTFIDQIGLTCTTTVAGDAITQVSLLMNSGPSSTSVGGPPIVMTRVGPAAFGSGSVYSGSLLVKAFIDPVSATVGNPFYLNIYHVTSANAAVCSAFVGGHTLTL